MQDNSKWVSERLEALLGLSEAYYRSVGFKRVAFHMRKTLQAVKRDGVAPKDFYPGYVSKIKEDSAELVKRIGIDHRTSEVFASSIKRSVDSLTMQLDSINRAGRVSLYEPNTSKQEDRTAMDEFIAANGLNDPGKAETPYDAVSQARPFGKVVLNHVYNPGMDYIQNQIGVALGLDKIGEFLEELFSVRAVMDDGISDFRDIYCVDKRFSKKSSTVKVGGEDVDMYEVARWPLLMYYKVPILTSMIAVHNVVFLSFVKTAVAEQTKDADKEKK
ncbi:MAG: hypothetical protein MJZ68_04970 [archaeon]|nr:hypothetical protein [archaeon]